MLQKECALVRAEGTRSTNAPDIHDMCNGFRCLSSLFFRRFTVSASLCSISMRIIIGKNKSECDRNCFVLLCRLFMQLASMAGGLFTILKTGLLLLNWRAFN